MYGISGQQIPSYRTKMFELAWCATLVLQMRGNVGYLGSFDYIG